MRHLALALLTFAGCDVTLDNASCPRGSWLCNSSSLPPAPACGSGGSADLTLTGLFDDPIQGKARLRDRSDAPGVVLVLDDRPDDPARGSLRVYFSETPVARTFVVREGVAIRVDTGVQGAPVYTDTAGTVTITEASPGWVRGTLDVGAAFADGEPRLRVTGTFSAEIC